MAGIAIFLCWFDAHTGPTSLPTLAAGTLPAYGMVFAQPSPGMEAPAAPAALPGGEPCGPRRSLGALWPRCPGRDARPRARGPEWYRPGQAAKVLLVHPLLPILGLSDSSDGRVHETPMADATPSPWPAGSRWDRTLAAWRSRALAWRSACRPGNHGGRRCHGSRTRPTRGDTTAGCGSSRASAVSRAVGSSQTGSGCGRRASVRWSWNSGGAASLPGVPDSLAADD